MWSMNAYIIISSYWIELFSSTAHLLYLLIANRGLFACKKSLDQPSQFILKN